MQMRKDSISLFEPEPYIKRPVGHRGSVTYKLTAPQGRLSNRALYIFVPAEYFSSHTPFPILFMHDGQNCFKTFEEDSYAGSWEADRTAEALIASAQMRPCLIVAVANGGKARIAEYLPPYCTLTLPPPTPSQTEPPKTRVVIKGQALKTFRYYRHDIANFLSAHLQISWAREDVATCGASMGGLFSAYIAWEHWGFAKHHACLSSSFWAAVNPQGRNLFFERLRRAPVRDVRVWLDSGVGRTTIRGEDDDNAFVTQEALELLRNSGYDKTRVHYALDTEGLHNEASWAKRLPFIFPFLLPA